MNNLRFYSNGKLLISGEYLVLKGATSLAIPVRLGQELHVDYLPDGNFTLSWNAKVQDEDWFEAVYDIPGFEIIETNDIQKAGFLSNILKAANKLNHGVMKNTRGIAVQTNAGFDINWGLGSSSTLIANIAKWFRVDPFVLHFHVSKGSGYDIACADAQGPIFYQLDGQSPIVEPAHFDPDFKDNLYFVYLGKKQRSDSSIQNLKQRLEGRGQEIERVSEISRELTATHDLEEFEFFINELEEIMSGVLGMPAVKQRLFSGFPGTVKSLGAWGGDFVMMTWRDGMENLKSFLEPKGLDIVFTFDDLKLTGSHI